MKSIFLILLALCLNLSAEELSPEMTSKLVESAMDAQKKAYAPYSHYPVGSAVVTKKGNIYSGCNIENASYGLCNCAERTAVFKAVSEGEHDIEAVAVVTKNGGLCCGACRQVLNEFNPNMAIICLDDQGNVHHRLTLDQLLPKAFGPSNLE